jgi:hypothetical protein
MEYRPSVAAIAIATNSQSIYITHDATDKFFFFPRCGCFFYLAVMDGYSACSDGATRVRTRCTARDRSNEACYVGLALIMMELGLLSLLLVAVLMHHHAVSVSVCSFVLFLIRNLGLQRGVYAVTFSFTLHDKFVSISCAFFFHPTRKPPSTVCAG